MPSETQRLRDALRRVHRRAVAVHAGAGFVAFAGALAWVLVAATAAFSRAHALTPAQARAASLAAAAVVAAAFLAFVAWPTWRMPRFRRIADEVERRRDLREMLRAAFEFSQRPDAASRYAPDLVREVVRRAVRDVAGIDVRSLFLGPRDAVGAVVGWGGLVLLLGVALVSPATLADTAARLVHPTRHAAREARPNLVVRPLETTVLAGSDVTVTALDLGGADVPVRVHWSVGEDFWKSEAVDPEPDASGEDDGTPRLRRYRWTFHDLRHTTAWRFSAGDDASATGTIHVVHEPILTGLTVTLVPPPYTGGEPEVHTDDGGNVEALAGTHVRVEGRSNNPLASARVRFDDGPAREVAHDGRAVSFEFDALHDGTYTVMLEDTLGFRTSDPVVYGIRVYPDRPPTVEVLEPGGDAAMPRSRRLDLGFVAADDWGVASAWLFHRRQGEGRFHRVRIPLGEQRGRRDVAVAWRWDLASLRLYPGDAVEYYVEVHDNNTVTGPGIGRSRTQRLTVPTMAQLFEQARREDRRRTDVMDRAVRTSRELRRDLETLRREFLKSDEVDWSRKQQVDRAISRQAQVEKQLEDVKRSLDETMRRLSENRMTSQRIGEKMEEIRRLLDEIDSDALRRRMEELRRAIEKLDPQEVERALRNLDVDAGEMLRRLERTAELLEQVRREQQMEEIVRGARDLMESQGDLNDETARADSSDAAAMRKLADRQDELARQSDALQHDLEEMAKTLAGDDSTTAAELSRMAQQMQSPQGPKSPMDEASRRLRGGQPRPAQLAQQQAMERLISLFRRAGRAQQAMQMNAGQKLAANFQKYARRALEISRRQEALARRIGGDERAPGEPSQGRSLAQAQMSNLTAVRRVAEGIQELAGRTTAASSELLEAVDSAIRRMESSVLFLEQNKAFMSRAHASGAVESLNRAVIEMMRGAKQCSQGQPGAGEQSAAQQLMSQLIPAQQNVTEQTRQMLEMQATQERLMQERLAQLQRLAGQQRALREMAEKIQRELQQNGRLLGRLDRTVEEMEAVARALEQGLVDEDLVRREQRILSRLLDAQRSVYTRDYENRRESRTAADVFSRGARPGTRASRSLRLREQIRRAMELRAPGEYQELIRMYFRALAEESAAPAGGGR